MPLIKGAIAMTEIDCLPVKTYAERSGRTEKSIRRKIQRGVWREGREWFRDPDGRIAISISGVEQWVRLDYQQESKYIVANSESGLCGRGADAENLSPICPSRQQVPRRRAVYVLK